MTTGSPTLIGAMIGESKVIGIIGRYNSGNIIYKVQYPCGHEGQGVKARIIKVTKCISCCKVTHGLAYHPVYNIYINIIDRCYNKKCPGYKNYGERGIRMYQDWIDHPGIFVDWVEKNLGPKSNNNSSLDRINNDGDYRPGNLRWANATTQANNRRVARERIYYGKWRIKSKNQ